MVPRGLVLRVATRHATGEDRERDRDERKNEWERVGPEDRRKQCRLVALHDDAHPCRIGVARDERDVVEHRLPHERQGHEQTDDADHDRAEHDGDASGSEIEGQQDRRQELDADRGGERDRGRAQARAPVPCEEREGERDEVEVAERHFEHRRQEEAVARGGPRPERRWQRADERDADRDRQRELYREPEPHERVDREWQRGHERQRDDRQVVELVRCAERCIGRGKDGRAVDEMPRREPVGLRVIAQGQCARGEDGEQERNDGKR